MSSEPAQANTGAKNDNSELVSATSRLTISDPIISNTQATPIEIPNDGNEGNPWDEQAEAAHKPLHRLTTPDPTDLERVFATGDAKAPSPPVTPPTRGDSNADDNARVSGEILREFDPLVDSQEKDAQEAWATAEAHPPPMKAGRSWSPTSSPDSRPRTPQNQPSHGRAQSISSGLSLPSLTSFARSVQASVSETVAGLASRPRSMEANPSLLSPSTITSFVTQGGERSRSGSRSESRAGEGGSNVGGASGAGSSSGDEEAPGEPQFDFPRFLEQMKARSAEPVAKYLRS
jgi:hypothetical protein